MSEIVKTCLGVGIGMTAASVTLAWWHHDDIETAFPRFYYPIVTLLTVVVVTWIKGLTA